MAENNKPANVLPAVALDDGSLWASFTINGKAFEVEIYDAYDMLAEIDARHRYDPVRCLKCQKEFVPDGETWGRPDKMNCPHCSETGRDNFRMAQEFLDDVGELLKKRFGVTRCARREAANFYNAIIEEVEEVQKKTTALPESDSGSTLTPDD